MPSAEGSILNTTKQMLGIPSTDTSFDTDIIAHINSAFMSLNQIGVGPETGFNITDATETWGDFLATDLERYGALDSYIYFKTRQAFDPPGTSFVISSIQTQIDEIEYRFKLQAELLAPIPEPVIPEEEL